MLLDPRSVIFFAGFMGVLMAVVLFGMRRSYPQTIGGLSEWTVAPVLCFASTLMFGLRGVVPDIVSVLAANLVLFGGCVLYYTGSLRFFDEPPVLRGWVTLMAALGVLLAWFTLVQPSYAVRLACFTLCASALFMSHAALYLRQLRKKPSFALRFMAAVLLMQSLALIARLVTVFTGAAGGGLMDNSPVQSAYIAVFALTAMMLTLGAILMATDRVRTEFEWMATHDPLTGVLNRRAMLAACTAELEHSRAGAGAGNPGPQRPLALMMLDIDHFKSLNDAHGHHVGDQVLQRMVRRLEQVLRPGQYLGRHGGEEFVVLLSGIDLPAALALAERMRTAAAAPAEPRGTLPWRTVSIGVSALREGPDSVDAMLLRADTALYRAKALGRDRVESEA
ncbi:diguanylate cyclase [Sphingomonas sp. NCPPB 2930]